MHNDTGYWYDSVMCDCFRSVSEKEDRPLSRLRPGSAVEERANIKKVTTKLTKYDIQ